MAVVIQPIIGDPHPFNINFQQVRAENAGQRTLLQRVKQAAFAIFEYLKIAGSSVGEACYTNIRYLPETIRVTFTGRIRSAEEFLLRLGLLIVLHVIGIAVITVFVFKKKLQALPGAISQLADTRLNLEHLKRKSTTIQTNHIPANVTVSTLQTIFDECNFTRPDAPGYMAPQSLREGNRIYSAQELARHLQVFIQKVISREAFLGTPPAYAPAQLMQFYLQVESAVRFAVEKVERDLDAFLQTHGRVSKEHEKYKEYNDLLQARSRLAIDMAIAGIHCGARYMGDAMDAYYFHKGEGTEAGSLKERISDFLAVKRLEIARGHIPVYLGNDTHDFAAYMANLGGILGIPDTENVVEHLRGADRATLIAHFFRHNPNHPELNVYNSRYIKDAIQEKIKDKKSQSFRELIFDWIKGQAGDWRKSEFDDKATEIFQEIQGINPPEKPALFTQIEVLVKLLDSTPIKPDPKKWDMFFANLLSTTEAKAFVDDALGTTNLNQMQKMTARYNWKAALSELVLIPELQKLVAKTITLESLLPRTKEIAWAKEVNIVLSRKEVAPINMTSFLECHGDKEKIKNLLKDQLNQTRGSLFLESVTKVSDEEEPAVSVAKEGLKPAVLEWLLVSHSILNPPTEVVQG